jgi:hypothetical protein
VRCGIGAPSAKPLLENKRASRLILRGMVGHAPGFPLFKPLNAEELRAVSVVVVLLIATESESFDPHLLAARADALLPQVSIESHVDICAARIALADT